MFFIHTAIAVSVFEPGNSIFGAAFVGWFAKILFVFGPGGDGDWFVVFVDLASAGIFGSFSDPQAAFFIEIERDGFFDQRFGCDEADVEVGMSGQFGGG